jgi:hypothetical protein
MRAPRFGPGGWSGLLVLALLAAPPAASAEDPPREPAWSPPPRGVLPPPRMTVVEGGTLLRTAPAAGMVSTAPPLARPASAGPIAPAPGPTTPGPGWAMPAPPPAASPVGGRVIDVRKVHNVPLGAALNLGLELQVDAESAGQQGRHVGVLVTFLYYQNGCMIRATHERFADRYGFLKAWTEPVVVTEPLQRHQATLTIPYAAFPCPPKRCGCNYAVEAWVLLMSRGEDGDFVIGRKAVTFFVHCDRDPGGCVGPCGNPCEESIPREVNHRLFATWPAAVAPPAEALPLEPLTGPATAARAALETPAEVGPQGAAPADGSPANGAAAAMPSWDALPPDVRQILEGRGFGPGQWPPNR